MTENEKLEHSKAGIASLGAGVFTIFAIVDWYRYDPSSHFPQVVICWAAVIIVGIIGMMTPDTKKDYVLLGLLLNALLMCPISWGLLIR